MYIFFHIMKQLKSARTCSDAEACIRSESVRESLDRLKQSIGPERYRSFAREVAAEADPGRAWRNRALGIVGGGVLALAAGYALPNSDRGRAAISNMMCAREARTARAAHAAAEQACGNSLAETRLALSEMRTASAEMRRSDIYGSAKPEDLAAADSVISGIFGRSPNEVPFNLETLFSIYDWVARNIAYDDMSPPARRSVSEVIARRRGDCDEVTAVFAAMVERLAPHHTRAILTFSREVPIKHAYAQVFVGDYHRSASIVSELSSLILRRGYDTGIYGADRVRASGSVARQGLDLESGELWFTFDVTMGIPGDRECRIDERDCRPYLISYPDERLDGREGQMDAGLRPGS
jgi:hypothetical protein